MAITDTVKDLAERHAVDATLRHKLAMEAIGLVRTALHFQRPVLEALLDGERAEHDGTLALPRNNARSFELQKRMARTCLAFLNDLDALANEALELAEKEKRQ